MAPGTQGIRRNPGNPGLTKPRQGKMTTCVLECGCLRDFGHGIAAPKVKEVICCVRHGVSMVTAHISEYVVRCTQCRYARHFGAAKLTALTTASTHSVKKRHRVNIFFGDELFDVAGSQHEQLELRLNCDDKPPF